MMALATTPNIRSQVRDGLILAVVAMIAAVGIRFAVGDAKDPAHYEGLGAVTGIDFGDWPQFFYSGGGGDGEIFAVIAADPAGTGPGQAIPAASYRYQRLGFPLLAWLLSFGQSSLILPALALIGLLSIGGIGFISGYNRERLGWTAWLLVLNPAIYIGFFGDTAEPLALLVLCVSLTGAGVWAGIALAVTRPTFLTGVANRWSVALAGGIVAVGIRLAAVARFPEFDLAELGQLFALPFTAYLGTPSYAGLTLALSAIFTVAVGVRKRDLAWMSSGLLVASFGPVILGNPINAVRAAAVLPVLWAFGPARSDVLQLKPCRLRTR